MEEKLLIVGDPHGKLSNLEDFKRALKRIADAIIDQKPSRTIFLGDQFDTFAVLRSEVLSAWSNFIDVVHTKTQLTMLVGNHDYAGPEGGTHALETFRPRVTVIDRLTRLGDRDSRVYAMPFMRDRAEFERAVRHHVPEGAILFCHQSFDGAQFENGFYDPHGADTESVAHLAQVISGHVHRRQELRNIIYPGTPWQMTFSDAGEQKGIFWTKQQLDGQGRILPFRLSNPYTLGMPEFHVVQARTPAELLERLPTPVSQNYYRFVAEGTPQEVEAFWKDPKVVEFRKRVRRVDNSMRVVRGQTVLTQVKGDTLVDRVTSFVSLREWKVGRERLVESAGRLLASGK